MQGDQVTLSCRYSVSRYGLSSACWGRGCGTLWCSGVIVQTDGGRVLSKASEKYRLTGDLGLGLVDLTITNVSWVDGGPYCCRVDINGYFNDKKVIHSVQLTQAVAVFPTPAGTHAAKESGLPTDRSPGTKYFTVLEEDAPSRHANQPKPGTIKDEPTVDLWLHIRTPVLSLSLSLLFLLLLGAVALLGFKRKIHKRCSFRSRTSLWRTEPHHIFSEIQARRPVEENIYTLD